MHARGWMLVELFEFGGFEKNVFVEPLPTNIPPPFVPLAHLPGLVMASAQTHSWTHCKLDGCSKSYRASLFPPVIVTGRAGKGNCPSSAGNLPGSGTAIPWMDLQQGKKQV